MKIIPKIMLYAAGFCLVIGLIVFYLYFLTLVSKKEETDTGLFYATVGWVVGAIHFGALYCITSACVLYIEKQTKDSKK